MAFMDAGFFSLAYGTRGPGFASGANKISKQIQTNVLAHMGFTWSVYFSFLFFYKVTKHWTLFFI
jgi:hypothetical protein